MEEKLTIFKCPHCGKQIGVCTVSYVTKIDAAVQTQLIDHVREALSKWVDDLDVIENEQTITVTPKGFLRKDVWYEINDALKVFDAEWISAGKESRWVIHVKDVE